MSEQITKTKAWIEQFVMRYHLCPFATKPFREDRIRYVVFDGQDAKTLLALILAEVRQLQTKPAAELETTLIIHPHFGLTFESYLDLIGDLDDMFEELELMESVQLASFHPDYQFAGTEYEAPENFTNRSPFPMIHLLRVDSVSDAIENYPGINVIPTNNIARMQQIGSAELIKIYHEIIGKN